ncbi:hypothetical protein HYU96_04835 [Candidatus Daviesbacteria bacterium]|nr:hypothetical protein [Candidatus Daviesbacteria bacterium]
MIEGHDTDFIEEIYRLFRSNRAVIVPSDQEAPDSGRNLTPLEIYDNVVELLPLAVQTVRNRPEYKAYRELAEHRTAQAITRGEKVDRVRPIFKVAGQPYCMTDELEYNSVAIARFNVNEDGKPTNIAEEMLIYGGVEGSEDPFAQQPQRISYFGAKLFERMSQNPDSCYPVDNTDRVVEEIRGFLDRLAKA